MNAVWPIHFGFLWLIAILPVSGSIIEERARVVIERFDAASKAKNVEAISKLLSTDCFIVMTEPAAGSNRARCFSREGYLKLLAERASKARATETSRVVKSVSVSDVGEVFVVCDSDERSRIGDRSEWIRSYEYILMKESEGRLLIRAVMAELAFYIPDVPKEPPAVP